MRVKLSRRMKQLLLAGADVLCAVLSAVLAFFLIEFYVNTMNSFYLLTTASYIVVYLIAAVLLHVYAKINRYFGFREALEVLLANFAGLIGSFLISRYAFSVVSFRFIVLLFFFMTIFSIAMRIGWRLISDEKLAQKSSRRPVEADRVLLVGAGEGGHIFIERFRNRSYNIVGFVDADPEKHNTYLAHVPILGTPDDIPRIVREYQVQMIIITAPSMPAAQKEHVLELANEVDVPVRQMPNVETALISRMEGRSEEHNV